MNQAKHKLSCSEEPIKKMRPRKQIATKACRRKLPSSVGVKKPSTKDHPPKTKVQQYVEQYCKKTGVCATSPAYRPTSPAYPPTLPPYVPTSPSYNSISSTSLFDDTKILEVPSVWLDKDFFGSSDESDY